MLRGERTIMAGLMVVGVGAVLMHAAYLANGGAVWWHGPFLAVSVGLLVVSARQRLALQRLAERARELEAEQRDYGC